MSQRLAHGVLLADTAGVGYLVDQEFYDCFLRRKRVWTREDGTLMVRVHYNIHAENEEELPLSLYVWEIHAGRALSPREELRFTNGRPRDCRFANLEAVPKKQERSA